MDEGVRKSAAAAAVLVCAASGLAWYLLRPESSPPPEQVLSKLAPPPAAAPASLPALDQSDPLLRARLGALGKLPQRWLSTDALVRRLVAAAHQLAEGESPRASLPFLAPEGRFLTRRQGGRLFIDERGYKRYDGFAEAVASVDAQDAAKVIGDLAGLFAQACGELDAGRCDFSADVRRAAALLLDAPVPKGPVAVKRKIKSWVFADPALEALAPAQKHLLRMGPRNEVMIQAKLRELSAALGPSPK